MEISILSKPLNSIKKKWLSFLLIHWRRMWRTVLSASFTPRIEREHRQLLLQRARILCWMGPPLYIFTVLVFNYKFYPASIIGGLLAIIPSSIGHLLLLGWLRHPFIQKHYNLPFFLLIGVFANFAESANLQITGGGKGFFFFSYLLLYFVMAVYYPGYFAWVLATALSLMTGYVGSEWLSGRDLFSVEVFSNVLYLIDGAVIGTIGSRVFYHLFIREKKNQIALEEANEKLKVLDQAKSSFFANISHELKTPMTLVVAPLENALLKVPKGAPEIVLTRANFETVRHNAYRLSGLIGDLLDLTKSEIGKARISPVVIPDATEFVKRICDSVAPLVEEKGLELEFVVGPPVEEGLGSKG